MTDTRYHVVPDKIIYIHVLFVLKLISLMFLLMFHKPLFLIPRCYNSCLSPATHNKQALYIRHNYTQDWTTRLAPRAQGSVLFYQYYYCSNYVFKLVHNAHYYCLICVIMYIVYWFPLLDYVYEIYTWTHDALRIWKAHAPHIRCSEW